MKNMPQLAGTIHSFEGDQAAHGQLIRKLETGADYSDGQRMTDLVLTPAGCYPLYPTLRGDHAAEGRVMECSRTASATSPPSTQHACRCSACASTCASRAGSGHLLAIRLARPRDGDDAGARAEVHVALANDPFFGAAGVCWRPTTRAGAEYELVVPITSSDRPRRCSRSTTIRICSEVCTRSESPGRPRTPAACFGMERVALALLKTHGLESGALASVGAGAAVAVTAPPARSMQPATGLTPCTRGARLARDQLHVDCGSRCCTRSVTTHTRCSAARWRATSKKTSGVLQALDATSTRSTAWTCRS